MIDSKKVTSFTPRDLEMGLLVFILKNQMASEDGFHADCKSILGPAAPAEVKVKVVTGVELKAG